MALNGIDTSNYQSGIGKVSGDFRIIKATEGTGYTNPALSAQIKSAPSLLGFYHFASNGDYKKEADHFISKVKSYVGKAILVLDYEPKSPSVTWAKNWLDYVYSKTGVRPLIYMGLAVENAYDWSAVAKNYGLWVAQYNNYNTVSGFKPRSIYGSVKHWKSMAIFQYSSAGRLSGYSGNLDFDVFYGTKATWDAYAKKAGSKAVAASAPAVEHYNWNPRLVKSLTAVYTYKDKNCKAKVKKWPKGTQFDVAKLVHVSGSVYRFQLANGLYLSGWKDHFLNMYYADKSLQQVKLLKTVYLYKDVDHTKKVRSYPKDTVFDVKTIDKSKTGLWEIKTASGYYITANKNYVRKTK
ncbi:DUF5776 domain-containing protein [Pediococcus inopinatus]|uniref:DUF5776 domain-containing protein n=1 Tax=Pediococcus inopinatus TaxID=114090 RepID=A0ABZ0Q3X3_9LACO|nr:DUF5776 domain-containing protein [Pediococcus inopinatus]WPC20848.1 DUF5776 domain-containing protein [Pediococcus inopinatus]